MEVNMAGTIEMTPEEVAQAAVDTTNAKLEVDSTLDRLKALCDDLAAGWSGRGAAAFQNTMLAWDDQAAKLLDALEDIATQLDASSAAQAEQDAAADSSFAGFEGEL
jgi:WXG100 family type VII secretion target